VLRVAIHTEPQTRNRLRASDLVTHVVTDQLHAPLIHLNPRTQQMEPALAESWEMVEDDSGARIVFHL
jgi:ABC-type transport system substrate-binding protein